MKTFFLALICALVTLSFPAATWANSDVYACEAYAEFPNANGTAGVVRQSWPRITYAIGHSAVTPYALVAYSGDVALDQQFVATPLYLATPTVQRARVLSYLSGHVRVQIMAVSRAAQLQPPKKQGLPRHEVACWLVGTPPPDLSAWPKATRATAQQSGITCRGAVYFRIRDGEDLSPEYEIVLEKTGLAGPTTAAWSELRKALIDAARTRAYRLTGDANNASLSTRGGQMDPVSLACWSGSKPPTPSDWRGPTAWS